MIKILINNEEVVCNNNISIKEEMLSTSSTILKNCYPKSWELDKDYVSRYYFPKDYSKCKITDDVYHPEVIGTRVSGTNFTINYDNTLNWNLEEIKGDTLQDSQPTPDTPVEIQSVTGLQNVNVCGKNLCFNITKPANANLKFFINKSISKTFTISFTTNEALNGNSLYLEIDGTSYGNIGGITASANTKVEKTYTLSDTNYQAIQNGTNIDLLLYKNGANFNIPEDGMVENNSTATTYEPYNGNTYEVNLGKNLFDINNANWILFSSSYPATYDSENNGWYNKHYMDLEFTPITTQTFSFDIKKRELESEEFNYSGKWFIRKDGTVVKYDTGGNSDTYVRNTYTMEAGHTYLFRIYNHCFINDIQLEQGSKATTYTPYFTPIELNKIGDYQDSIKKSTGKNLFDANNNTYKDTSVTHTINNTNKITVTNSYSWARLETTIKNLKPNTNYTISTHITNTSGLNCGLWGASGLSNLSTNTNFKSSITKQSDSSGNLEFYFYVNFSGTTTSTGTVIFDTIQLEENSQATSYEPYGKVWYVEKQIGKVVLDGSETYYKNTNIDSANYNCFYTIIPNVLIETTGAINIVLSNCFLGETFKDRNKDIANMWGNKFASQLYFKVPNTIITTSDLQTWLSTHNTEVVYVLATPTYTEITNTELINQLESIELLKGTNNITITSENLPMIMQLYYNYKEAYTSEDLLFCGCVKNTGNISLNPRDPHYVDLQLLDFKCLLSEGETLNYVITGKTIAEAINQVVASISDYGFVVGNIQLLNSNEVIGAYSTLNKTPYDVFQYFADITQSRWTTRMIDENTIAIDFYDPTLLPTADPIQSTQSYYENNKIVDISFNYSTNDYRNKQIMTSDEVYGNITQTETLIADGYSKTFMCQNKIGTITGITLNGASATFITKSEEQLGTSGDFIYQPGEMQFVSSNTIGTGSVIVITYYPIIKGREIILNSTESSRISTQIGRKGTISRYENRNDTTSSQELQKIGQSYIKYKGQAEIVLKVVSENNIFNVGQIVEYQAPLEDLSTEYMVKSKEINWYINADKTFYTYELTSNFNYENAINYFDNQRAKNQGNIGEGEVISRAIDLENTANLIFYDTDIEEIELQNPTSLDFTLDGVLI